MLLVRCTGLIIFSSQQVGSAEIHPICCDLFQYSFQIITNILIHIHLELIPAAFEHPKGKHWTGHQLHHRDM